jgi:hypothetical protein
MFGMQTCQQLLPPFIISLAPLDHKRFSLRIPFIISAYRRGALLFNSFFQTLQYPPHQAFDVQFDLVKVFCDASRWTGP